MIYRWKAGDTWVKVAYTQLGEETRYRELIEANPGFSPSVTPPFNYPLVIPESTQESKDNTQDNSFYPWVSRGAALERLLDYTPLSILLSKKINGPSITEG